MTDSNYHPPPLPSALSSILPIAQIAPTLKQLHEHSVRAVVTLVWPYSSATKSLSLLLAEPDFRLRRSNGQVKVIFHGSVAEKVATTHAGIGDEFVLNLAGSRLVNNSAGGNYVAWDLHFDDRVFLEVFRSSKHISTVEVKPLTEPSQTTDEDAAPPSTPQNDGAFLGETGPTPLDSWGSPAFSQRSRVSFGGLVDTPFDLFAEEDGFIPGKGRKRPRLSMRSNEWRVVDEPESPREKEEPVDWMELEAELSEQELEDKDLAEDIKEIETPAPESSVLDTRESDKLAELRDGDASVRPLSEPGEALYGPDLEQLAKCAAQSAEFNARRSLENGDRKARARGPFDHLIHLPTDTPRLYPVPSPGLPVPSPLVASNNPNGYFTPFATTTQTSLGRSFTVGTQATTTTGETDTSSQMQPMLPQPQTTPLDTGREPERGTPSENGQVPRALGVDIPNPWPTTWPNSVDEATGSLHLVNVQLKGAIQQVSGYDEGGEQAGSAALEAAEEQQATIDVAECSGEESLVGEQESDVDQEYSDEDDLQEADHLQKEEELSGQEELGEEVVEHEQELHHQRIDSKDLHGRREADVIDLDSNESGEEGMEWKTNDYDATAGEADAYPSITNDLSGRGRYPDYHEEDDETGGDIYEEYSEDNSEEIESDYMSENEYHDGYGDQVHSEIDSEVASDEEKSRQPSAPAGVPEVIVLDSDSDEEPPPSIHKQLVERPKQEVFASQEPRPAGLSSDRYSNSAAAKEELMSVSEEQSEEDSLEDESMDDNDDDDDDDVRAAWKQCTPPASVSASAIDSRKEPTLDNEAGILETTGQVHESDQMAHDHNYRIDHYAQQSDVDPESTVGGVSMATYPDLVEVNAEKSTREGATEQEMDLAEVRKIRPEQSPEASRQGEEINRPIWLDGAASPAPVFKDATMDNILPTPQDSHDAAVESALQDQIGAPPTPSKDALSIESDFEPGSAAVQGRDEIRKPYLPEDVEEQEYPEEDESPDEVGRDTSPAASGRYFSPPTGSDYDAPILYSKPIHAAASGSPEELEQRGEGGPAHGEIGRDRSVVSERYFSPPTGPDSPHTPDPPSRLAHIAPLATLVDYSDALIDTISIVCEVLRTGATPEQSDHILTIQVTDPSMAGSSVPVMILHPDSGILLSLAEGDAILFRNFQVKVANHTVALASVGTSSWNAFRDSGDDTQETSTTEERNYASSIQQWYRELGASMVADSQLQASIGWDGTQDSSGLFSDEESIDSEPPETRDNSPSLPRTARRRRRAHRKVIVHELRDGRRYTQVGSPPGSESIHLLRDGTVYANL